MRKQYKSKNKFGLNKEDFESYEEYRKEYMRLTKQTEECKASSRKYKQSDKGKAARKKHDQSDKRKETLKRYNQSEKGKALAKAQEAKRRAAKLQRIVGWSELEKIKDFYKLCPPGYHVDHIIPLQGKLVSGLHVLANLQYLPAKENCSKGNKFEE